MLEPVCSPLRVPWFIWCGRGHLPLWQLTSCQLLEGGPRESNWPFSEYASWVSLCTWKWSTVVLATSQVKFQVFRSEVGKYLNLFSGDLLSIFACSSKDDGQPLSVALCPLSVPGLQLAQWKGLLVAIGHEAVQCCSVHLAHLSFWALHSDTKCPYTWHFRHLWGSVTTFLTMTCFPSI